MKILYYSLLFLVFTNLNAQQIHSNQWVYEKQKNPNISFIVLEKLFDTGWENKDYVKGNGWKQFNRYRDHVSSRLDSNGNLINLYLLKENYNQFKQKSNSSNGSWAPIGPTNWVNGNSGYNPGLGRVNAVTVSASNPNIIFIAAASGGIWKSNDGGQTWNTTTDDFLVLGTSDIAIDPNNDSIVYVATGDRDGLDTYGFGVMKSTDGGFTWNTTNLISASPTLNMVVNKLLHHPTSSNILFAATNYGLYKTTDGGLTWVMTFPVQLKDLEFQPNNPNVVFACNDAFYKSTDGGNTFNIIYNGLPSAVGRMVISITPNDSNFIYALIADNFSDFKGVYQSIDAGDTWNIRIDNSTINLLGYANDGSDNSSQAWYDLAIAVDPLDKYHIYTGGVNVWESYDGGMSFYISSHWVYNQSNTYSHADIHSLDYYNNELYCGSDGGIFKLNSAGWSNISFGLNTSQVYRLGLYPSDENLLVCGLQDNGSNLYNYGVWNHVFGADGMEAMFNPTNYNEFYCTYQNGGLLKTTDFGQNFSTGFDPSNFNENAGWITPYTINPMNTNELLIGCKNIYKTTDGCTTWNPITSNLSSTPIDILVYAPSNNSYIYAAEGKNLFYSYDAGATWTTKFVAFPYTNITDIEVDIANPLHIFLTLGGASNGFKIIHSLDGGQTFSNISLNLPNIPTNTLALDYNTPGGIYVGTDLGIYYIDSTLNQWVLFDQNLPNVIVKELEINYSANKLFAATFGRGIWESPLYSTLVNLSYQKIENGLSVYPNPSKNTFTLQNDNSELITKVLVLNVAGFEIKKIENTSNTNQLSISLENEPEGVYFFKISTDNGYFVKKVLLKK